MDQAEERAFVRRLVRMDERAWETFCSEHSTALRNFVQLQFGCTRETAEDLVQMSFVRCVKSIKSFDPSRGRLFAWLKAVARNEAHTLLRERQSPPQATADTGRLQGFPYEAIDHLDHALLPDEVLAQQEVRLLIHEVMAELYSRYRQVLVLKYIDSRKVSEIAQLLGESDKAVESFFEKLEGGANESRQIT
jgi:RNA polymerase sigma-70 factor (ECF subfamily)